MCGITGLFVGCTALDYCPKRMFIEEATGDPVDESPETSEPDECGYRSPFAQWDARAAVRSAPRRVLDSDDEGLFFTPDLVPLAKHPLLHELCPGVFQEVLIQHLYRYLDFTTKLEHLVVNRTALGIAHGTVDIDLPDRMRFDAYRIYCDEAYHALFSQDLLRQVATRTGTTPRLPRLPYFLVRLQQIQQDTPAQLRSLIELLFVIVSETLISATLTDVPADPQVVPIVNEVIRDHALDEGRHHAYFAAFLRILWGTLPPDGRITAALLIPDLVRAFLEPDRPAAREELLGYGLAPDSVEQIIAETWPEETVRRATATAATRTIRYFQELGALDNPQVAESFAQAGLVTG